MLSIALACYLMKATGILQFVSCGPVISRDECEFPQGLGSQVFRDTAEGDREGRMKYSPSGVKLDEQEREKRA